jgi:hypothetical protein
MTSRRVCMLIAGMVCLTATACLVMASAVWAVGNRASLATRCRHSSLRIPSGVSVMATASQHGMRDKREQRQDMGGKWKHVDKP